MAVLTSAMGRLPASHPAIKLAPEQPSFHGLDCRFERGATRPFLNCRTERTPRTGFHRPDRRVMSTRVMLFVCQGLGGKVEKKIRRHLMRPARSGFAGRGGSRGSLRSWDSLTRYWLHRVGPLLQGHPAG